ncbi:MAG: DUF433 domain-containing protein [Planctomycetota bacterium]
MDDLDRIRRNPKTMMGKPCIRGTRLTVQLILERLAYHPKEELMICYPELTEDDIRAALLFAATKVGLCLTGEKGVTDHD